MVVVVAPHRLPQGQGLALETRAGIGGSASTTSAYLFLPTREWRSWGAVRPHLQSTAAVRATAQQQANGNCRALLSLALPAHQWRQGRPFSLWCPQSQGKGGIRGGSRPSRHRLPGAPAAAACHFLSFCSRPPTRFVYRTAVWGCSASALAVHGRRQGHSATAGER